MKEDEFLIFLSDKMSLHLEYLNNNILSSRDIEYLKSVIEERISDKNK